MRMLLLATALAATLLPELAGAQTLHVALREDPDVMDPTLARSFVGRIVFAGLCDKLFDVDEQAEHRARSWPPATSGRTRGR